MQVIFASIFAAAFMGLCYLLRVDNNVQLNLPASSGIEEQSESAGKCMPLQPMFPQLLSICMVITPL